MKAAVFQPRDISYTTVADPRIELATDIILRVTSKICGSDLNNFRTAPKSSMNKKMTALK